jgi:hypothetical protein
MNITRAAAALGRLGGKSKSAAKRRASANNGKLGGRPKGTAMKEQDENAANWIRTATGDGWVWNGWRVRGPIMGKRHYWLYRNNHRFTPTGKYDDVVFFKSPAAAKKFAESFKWFPT